MTVAWALTFATLVPFAGLGLLMWLARLEDTLGDSLDKLREAREPVATEPREAASGRAPSLDHEG